MKITREFLFQGKSEAGGWNKAQIQVLGDEWWPLQTGWVGRMEDQGVEVSYEAAQKFLNLKGITQKQWYKDQTERTRVYVLQDHEEIVGVFSSRTLAESASEEYLRKEKLAYVTHIVECILDSLVEE